jgi:type IV secretion system protein VirD4
MHSRLPTKHRVILCEDCSARLDTFEVAVKVYRTLMIAPPDGLSALDTARFSSTVRFDPLSQYLRDDGHSGSLNPLHLAARSGTDPAAIARSFAAELIERGDERDRFWNDWAETMITGGVAWLLSDRPAKERKLSKLFDLFTQDDVSYALAVLLDKKKGRNLAAKAAFLSFLQLPDHETRPSVLGTTLTHLRLFDSDLTSRLTDTTSFDLDALLAGKPMTLYIIVPPFRLNAYRPLLRAWLSGLMLAMTQRKSAPQIRTLMLCDEIGNLGRIDAFVMAATLMRFHRTNTPGLQRSRRSMARAQSGWTPGRTTFSR